MGGDTSQLWEGEGGRGSKREGEKGGYRDGGVGGAFVREGKAGWGWQGGVGGRVEASRFPPGRRMADSDP